MTEPDYDKVLHTLEIAFLGRSREQYLEIRNAIVTLRLLNESTLQANRWLVDIERQVKDENNRLREENERLTERLKEVSPPPLWATADEWAFVMKHRVWDRAQLRWVRPEGIEDYP